MAGFQFGGIGTKTKAKVVQNQKTSSQYILKEHFSPNNPYFLFLLEGIPSKRDLFLLENDIEKAGYKSYIIASATVAPYNKSEVKQVYEHMVAYGSMWRELIEYHGQRASAIMPFGSAIYSINKGVDIDVSCFYDGWLNRSYYYMGHGYVGEYDCFIVPVDSVAMIYPSEEDLKRKGMSPINWKTRFFKSQLEVMKGKMEMPMDISPFKQIMATDEYDRVTKPQEGRRSIQHKAYDILSKLLNSEYLAYDTETTSLKWYRGELVCITLCNDGKRGYYIPWITVKKNKEIQELLCQVFYSAKHIITANGKFDFHFIWNKLPGFEFDKIHGEIEDICLLAHCINSDRTKSLKSQTYFYTPFGGYDHELDVFKAQTGINNYGQIPMKILFPYATTDAVMSWRIYFALREHVQWIDENFPLIKDKPMRNWSMEKWYDNLIKPHYPDYIRAEHTGMMVDREYQLKMREFLRERKKFYVQKLSKIWNVPKDFDFGSTLKLGKLIESMGWPSVATSKAGNYATSDSCIQEWKRQRRPGIEELIALRETNSFLGTFVGEPSEDGNLDNATGWEQFIKYHLEDNSYRIHQSYQMGGTETFRNIGQDPNLQQIPAASQLAKEIKRCITVPTSLHYKITSDDGTVYEGGELDSVEVKGRGRITLDKVLSSNDIIPNTLQKFDSSQYDSFFEGGQREL